MKARSRAGDPTGAQQRVAELERKVGKQQLELDFFLEALRRLCREPLICRKSTLAVVLAKGGCGIELNDHLEYDDAALVFQHACKLGFEGIISKRMDSP
jgi:ATP-dependent DNA ligase